MPEYTHKKVLITVKAYPNPSESMGESSCIAGIDQNQKLIRLYPVPFRRLEDDKKFKKYQWVKFRVKTPTNDPRPETFRPDFNEIEPIGPVLSTKNSWAERRRVIEPCASRSLCYIQEQQKKNNTSLGIFKPAKIYDFTWEEENPEWTPSERDKIESNDLFLTKNNKPLEKIPYTFRFKFSCSDCKPGQVHHMKIVDWELYQVFRKYRQIYKPIDKALEKLRHRWLYEVASEKMTCIFSLAICLLTQTHS